VDEKPGAELSASGFRLFIAGSPRCRSGRPAVKQPTRSPSFVGPAAGKANLVESGSTTVGPIDVSPIDAGLDDVGLDDVGLDMDSPGGRVAIITATRRGSRRGDRRIEPPNPFSQARPGPPADDANG
jgi:hypothetical protein